MGNPLMSPVIIIAIAVVLLIPSTVFAQYMGNVGGDGETGKYTLEEALELQRRRIASAEANPAEREWITSGPFQIDRSQYAIGESVFIKINELESDEKGEIGNSLEF